MSFIDDLGGGITNIVSGVGDSLSGKSQAEIAKQQLANQQAAIAAIAAINQPKAASSNTGLIIGIVVAVLVIGGIILFVATRKKE